jgi:mannosyltransferase
VALLLLCAVALALRVEGLEQDLFGDELFTFDDVYGRSARGVVEWVRDGYEDNPPLFFLLAWAAGKLGDPTIWIRLPSVVLGTALVPLVYVLGARTVGRSAGIVGAAIAAISPFTVFYGGEARAYASLMFFSALSTVVLLRAVESPRRRWWLAYAACVCAVLYTHYTGAFVVLTQAVWAAWLYPERRLALTLANVGALVVYAPWMVTELTKDPTYTRLPDLSLRYALTTVAQTLPGHPLERPRDLPGRVLLALFIATLAIAAALAARARRGDSGRPRPGPRVLLLVALAAVTPCAIAILSLREHSILLPRSLSASVPAAVVLIGFLLTACRPRVAAVLTAAVLAVLAVGTVRALRDPPRDTGFREVADYIQAHRAPGDAVVYESLYHHPPHPLAGFVSAYLEDDGILVRDIGVNDIPAWRHAAAGDGRVFFVLQPIVVFGRPLELESRAGPGRCFALERSREVSQSPPLLLGVYSLPASGSLCSRLALVGEGLDRVPIRLHSRREGLYIAPWRGRRVVVAGPPVHGAVSHVSTRAGRVVVTGTVPPADAQAWVLAFRGDRLVAAGVPEAGRRDRPAAGGLSAQGVPFRIVGHPAAALNGDVPRLRVFRIVGRSAVELTQ